jgi:hypothetical protein
VCNLTYWYCKTLHNLPYLSDWEAARKASQNMPVAVWHGCSNAAGIRATFLQNTSTSIQPSSKSWHDVILLLLPTKYCHDGDGFLSYRTVKLLLSKWCSRGYLYFCQELLYTNLCWQVWPWTPIEVFPSRRSTDEHELASKCSSICECNTTQYRSWGKQNIT